MKTIEINELLKLYTISEELSNTLLTLPLLEEYSFKFIKQLNNYKLKKYPLEKEHKSFRNNIDIYSNEFIKSLNIICFKIIVEFY